MTQDYNMKILVDWGTLLFLIENRFRAAVRRYKDDAARLGESLATGDPNARDRQSRALLLDCGNVIELAGLANSVRLFVGWDAVRYDLVDVRAVRSELRKYFEEVQSV